MAVLSSQKLQNQVMNEKPVRRPESSCLLGPACRWPCVPSGRDGEQHRSHHLSLRQLSGFSCLAYCGPVQLPKQTQVGRRGKRTGRRPPGALLGNQSRGGHCLLLLGCSETLGWGGTPNGKLRMLGSEIYEKPSPEGFLQGHRGFAPHCYSMGVGGKVTSTHQLTESELHVAAAEKQQPGHVARGLAHVQGAVHLGHQNDLPFTHPRVQWQTVWGGGQSFNSWAHTEGLPLPSATQQCCLPQGSSGKEPCLVCFHLCCGYVHRD